MKMSCDEQLNKNTTHHHMCPETNVTAGRAVTMSLADSTANRIKMKQYRTQRLQLQEFLLRSNSQ